MKITHDKVFTPVTITFETQKELEVVTAAIIFSWGMSIQDEIIMYPGSDKDIAKKIVRGLRGLD